MFCHGWRFTLVLLLILIVTPRFSAAQTSSTPVTDKDAVAVEAVVRQVSDALLRVQKQRSRLHIPKLKSIDLTLQTIADKEVGGSFKLFIISFGAKHDYKETQEVTIHLTPPNPNNPTHVGAKSVTEALESVIISAAQGVQHAGSADYPLAFTALTVNLALTVTNSADGSGSITITPITVELSGKVSKANMQTLKIVFDDSKTATQKE